MAWHFRLALKTIFAYVILMSLNYLNDGIGELWAAQRSAIGLE